MADTTTTTTTPSWAAAIVALVATLGVAVAAWIFIGAPPPVDETDKSIIAFGVWLIRYGLVLSILGLAFVLAGGFAVSMGKKEVKTDGAQATLTPATAVGPGELLKELMGSAATLVAAPAGVGAFIMLIGAILVIGVAFAEPAPATTPTP